MECVSDPPPVPAPLEHLERGVEVLLREVVLPGPYEAVREVEGGPAIEGYVVAKVDLDQVRHFREEFQMFQCREPNTYRAVVKKY